MSGSPADPVWYVAQTKPNSDQIAERNLLRQGFHVYSPRVICTRRRKDHFRTESRPLFPGYLFVRADPEAPNWRLISNTFGVRRLVTFEQGKPSTVAPEIMALLMARCDKEGKAPRPRLSPGDLVRVLSGPFADVVARIEKLPSADRIFILLDFMGQWRRTSMSSGNVLLAS